jgi:hypothetical protein
VLRTITTTLDTSCSENIMVLSTRRGHMSHDLGTVTIFRLLGLGLGFGLGKGLGLGL